MFQFIIRFYLVFLENIHVSNKSLINDLKFVMVMSDDKKVRLPASTGGLMQYYDDYQSKISISPWHVIILTIAVMIFIIALHMIAP